MDTFSLKNFQPSTPFDKSLITHLLDELIVDQNRQLDTYLREMMAIHNITPETLKDYVLEYYPTESFATISSDTFDRDPMFRIVQQVRLRRKTEEEKALEKRLEQEANNPDELYLP